MRKTLFLATLVSFAAILLPHAASSQGIVRVYVGQPSSGFTSGADVGDSELDLIKELRHKETLTVVSSEADADIIIRVTNRHQEKSVGSFTTYNREKDDGRSTSTSYANQKTDRVVQATLTVDDFKLDLEGRSITWGGAADEIADQIEDWTHDNYARLMDRRSSMGISNAAVPEVPAPTEDVAIAPGMTPEQVRDAMGDPVKQVTFGTQTLWDYNGFQVVFEDGKVTDVKF